MGNAEDKQPSSSGDATDPGSTTTPLTDALRDRTRTQATEGQSPTVVFCNGLGETLEFWHRVIPQLDDIATFLYDRPGRSLDDLGAGLAGEIIEIDAITEDIDGPLIMVGHSFGGVLAEAYARARPDRVVGLILVDASTPDEYASETTDDHGRRKVGRVRSAITHAMVSDNATSTLRLVLPRAMVGLGTSTSNTKELIAMMPAEFADRMAHPEHLARAIHDNQHIGGYCKDLVALREEEPLAPMPVRVLVGGVGSRVWRREETDWITSQREQLGVFGDDVDMTVLQGAHMLMLDCPDDVAAAIADVHQSATSAG